MDVIVMLNKSCLDRHKLDRPPDLEWLMDIKGCLGRHKLDLGGRSTGTTNTQPTPGHQTSEALTAD